MTSQHAKHDPKAAAFTHFFNVLLIELSARFDSKTPTLSSDDKVEAESDGEVKFICYIR